MRIVLAGITIGMLSVIAVSTQTPAPAANGPKTTSDPTKAFFLPAAEVAATVGKLPSVAYANTTVLERADGAALGYRLAVDRRRPQQRGASHATEAELWAIIDGSGVITTGGTIVETKNGTVVERHIQGGTTHKVSKGDFLFIPEGVPHEVTGFTPDITMVTLEIPRPPAAKR